MVHYRHQPVWKVGPDFTQKEEHQKSALCYVTHDFSFIIYKENMSPSLQLPNLKWTNTKMDIFVILCSFERSKKNIFSAVAQTNKNKRNPALFI